MLDRDDSAVVVLFCIYTYICQPFSKGKANFPIWYTYRSFFPAAPNQPARQAITAFEDRIRDKENQRARETVKSVGPRTKSKR